MWTGILPTEFKQLNTHFIDKQRTETTTDKLTFFIDKMKELVAEESQLILVGIAGNLQLLEAGEHIFHFESEQQQQQRWLIKTIDHIWPNTTVTTLMEDVGLIKITAIKYRQNGSLWLKHLA